MAPDMCFGLRSVYRQGGYKGSVATEGDGPQTIIALPLAYTTINLYCGAIGNKRDDNSIPHVTQKTTTNFTLAMDVPYSARGPSNVWFISIGL